MGSARAATLAGARTTASAHAGLAASARRNPDTVHRAGRSHPPDVGRRVRGAVTIANSGLAAVSGWMLAFTFPGDQKITNARSGTVTQTGAAVSITNASYNGAIAPGSSVSPGFQGTWTSSDAAPTAFTVNGTPCSL